MALTNLKYLQDITEGDRESMREIINLFIEQVPEFIGNLKKHLAGENYVALGNEAHKAKSSVLIMGMENLGRDLKILQLATISGSAKDTYAHHVSRFETECLIAVGELKQALITLA
jgi:HPt (histidine-containing phosphotransfer) domain-containing protein